MGIAKVILNGVTQMDVTGDTVSSSNLLSGNTATGADGEKVNGSIATKTSSDLTVSGATVTAPAGHYASNASKSVASGSAGTPTASKGTVSNHSVSITPSVTNTTGYITGGTKTGTAVTVSAQELVSGTKTISASGTTDVTNYESVSVASGSATTPATTITANPTVSVNSSGLITATVSKTKSVTPTISAGYVSSGTAGTITVSGSGTSQLTTQAAQTIHPSTTDQTIASGKYLTGTQTIKAVTVTNLTAENIVDGVTVKIGDSTDDDCVASVTGTASGGRSVATISGTGDVGSCFVKHNGTEYYTNGDTFTYAIGDTLTCWVSYGDTNRLYVDDIVIAGGFGQAVTNYLYTLPAGGIEIELFKSHGTSYIKITTNEPTISITSNGTYDVYEYSKAEVNVTSGGGGSNADYIGMIERTTAATSLPNGVTTIGDYAFRGCSNLALTSLPSGVTSLGEYAFYGCSNLALTSLPSGITSVGDHAFYQCSRLALTSLPSGVTNIGAYAFQRCASITSISCAGAITSLGSNAFVGSSAYPMQIAHVSFPNMVVSSLGYVFGSATAANACKLLEDADIGNTKAIAANAFANCYKLQTLILRKSDAICTLANVNAFQNTPIRGYNGLSGTIYVPSALISTYQTATNWSTIYGEGHVTFAAIEGSQYEL